MTRVVWTAPLVAAAFVMAGCDGDDGRDGTDGADGANGLNSLISTVTLPKGDADCPGGGRVIQSGLDSNRNGILDPSEVTATEFIECATAPRLRALHASPDAPAVNVLVNGAVALTGVDYTDGSGFVPVTEVTRVQVEAILPGPDAIVIDERLDLEFSRDYTVIAAGRVAAPIGAFVVSNPTDAPIAPGNFRAQVAHAAPNAPGVDVYVTAPGADLDDATPINSSALAYENATRRVEAPAGDYQIRVTLAGDPTTVVFDSGTVALPAGADLLAVAVENTGPGDTPIQVVLLDGTASSDLFDVNTPASVVAVHASPDAPAVDVLADLRATATVEAFPLAQGLAYPQFCEIPGVPAPDEYTLSITAAGNPNVVALQFPLDVAQGNELTAIVTGYLTSTPEIQPLPLINDRRSVITEAKLRITHASPGTPAVDLYLVPDGTDLNDPATTPAFSGVPFGADTGILSIAPDVYDIYVTAAGSKTPAIEVQDFPLDGGDVLDVIARDPAGGATGPGLIVVDYASLTTCPNP